MSFTIDTDALKRVAIAAGKAGLPFIEQAISAAATGAAGPAGLIVGPALELLFPVINTALGLAPDTPPDQTAQRIEDDPQGAQAALAALDSKQQFQLATQKQADDTRIAAQAQQVALNTLDVSAQDRVQRWWRPAIGWGLGALVMLHYGLPYPVWLANWSLGIHIPDPPPLDQTAVIGLFTMLGVSVAAKSADKAVAQNTIKSLAKK